MKNRRGNSDDIDDMQMEQMDFDEHDYRRKGAPSALELRSEWASGPDSMEKKQLTDTAATRRNSMSTSIETMNEQQHRTTLPMPKVNRMTPSKQETDSKSCYKNQNTSTSSLRATDDSIVTDAITLTTHDATRIKPTFEKPPCAKKLFNTEKKKKKSQGHGIQPYCTVLG